MSTITGTPIYLAGMPSAAVIKTKPDMALYRKCCEQFPCCCCGCRVTRRWVIPLMVGVTLGSVVCIAFIIVVAAGIVPGLVYPDALAASASAPTLTPVTFTRGLEVEHTTKMAPPVHQNAPLSEDPNVYVRRSVYVGVLTLDKYVGSRAVSCNRTWARSPELSRVEYFVQLDDDRDHSDHQHLPLIQLTNDDQKADPYHTRKTFSMLEYVCHHHLDQYDWFMRGVDDMYVRGHKLTNFLSKLDSRKEWYLGHPTYAVEDDAFKVLGGQKYCLGGAGMLFSRPLLKRLCPHLSSCKSRFHQATPDVELSRCVLEYTGVECAHVPQASEFFYHSHQYNPLAVLEEFSVHGGALTLHPVKTPWLMQLLHQHHTQTLLSRQAQTLTAMADIHSELVSQMTSLPVDEAATSGVNAEISFLSDANNTYRASVCHPHMNTTNAERVEMEESIRRANFSCRLGDFLNCPRMLGGYQQHLREQSVFVVDLLCTNKTGHSLISKVVLTKKLSRPQLKKVRSRVFPQHLVVLVTADQADTRLLDFLLMLNDLVTESQQSKVTIFLSLSHRKKDKASKRMELPSKPDSLYSPRDIKNWYRVKHLDLHLYQHPSSSSDTEASEEQQQKIASMVQAIHDNYTDAIVLVTPPSVHFDKTFLQRCKVLPKAGSHVYYPYPSRQVVLKTNSSTDNDIFRSTFDVLWTKNGRPLCIHASDLWSHDGFNIKTTEPPRSRSKKLKVTRAYDPGLRVSWF